MEKIGKKLVFHFYIGKEGINTECNRLHFKCLEYYAKNVFDKVVFCIAVDNAEERKEDILELEEKIIGIFNTKEIEFKVVDNTYLRDSRTFYDEVATKLSSTEEIVFFGHNKGTTNVNVFDREKILKWVAAMYFACFSDLAEVEKSLTDFRSVAYGGLLNIVSERLLDKWKLLRKELGKYGYLYTGTFFWLNPRVLNEYIVNNGLELPQVNDRWYAENFLANIVPQNACTSLKDWRAMDYLDAHDKILDLINLSFTKESLVELTKFYEAIGLENVDKKPVIEIIYIATNNYINYLDGFLKTLQYFYPGAKKILKVITNKDVKVEPPCDDVIKCEVIKTFDLFYPCINLHKTKFIEQIEHDKNAEYIFYFDADTRFINNPDYDWESLRESMDRGFFVMSAHPIYVIKDEEWKNAFLNNLFNGGITDKQENFAAAIPSEQYTYVISSFFCGRKETILHVCHGINEMILSDMVWQKHYHIPRFSDENYFNKLVYNRENNLDDTYCVRVGFFTCIEAHDNLSFPTLFLYQKGMDEAFKSVKR